MITSGLPILTPVIDVAIVIGTVIAMEAAAWAAHKYIMHQWGWGWHQSHHRRSPGVLEKNDLYAAVFGGCAIMLFVLTPTRAHWLFWVAVGLTTYGVLYSVLHDGLVHQRWPIRAKPANRYLQHLVRAHRMHHATTSRDGGVSFGFLYAPPLRKLADQLRRHRAESLQP